MPIPFGYMAPAGPLAGSDCVLLLHMNGADEGTTFVDSSPSGHTVTANGDAETSTDQTYFGPSSYYGTQSGSGNLSVADSSDWDFGTDDFTMDCWVRVGVSNGFIPVLSQGDMYGNDYWWFYIESSRIRFQFAEGGTARLIIASDADIALNTWHHVALTRDGSTFRIGVDGDYTGSGSTSHTMPSIADSVYVGKARLSPDVSFEGYIDEVRIRNGTAEWTSDFTPYTLPYV